MTNIFPQSGLTGHDNIAVIDVICKTLDCMSENVSLSTRRMISGILFGSIVGLTCYILFEAGYEALSQVIATQFFGFERQDLNFAETGLFVFFFGAPIAMMMGLLVGLPIWKYAEKQSLRSNRSAALYGAICGGFIGFVCLIIELGIGLEIFLDDGSTFNSWTYGYLVTKDGLPTALGWALQFKTLVFFVTAGSLAGLATRLVSVPR